MKETAPPDFVPGTGFVPSPEDHRDHRLLTYVPEWADVLKEVADVKVPYTPTLPVYNQGSSPQCVAFSAALASTIDQRRDHRRTLIYDAPELYARCKERDGIPGIDGTYPRVSLQIKKDRGMRVMQSPILAEVGHLDQIGAYVSLATIDEVIAAISLFGSVILGSTWYASWFDIPNPVTKVFPPPQGDAGGHAYTAVGWNRNTRRLLVQNSWGPYWGYVIGGTDGRAWLPFEYIDFNDFEAWRSVDIEDN